MALPSNVAVHPDDVKLVDLDQLPYLYATRPSGARLKAWAQLEEVERRWVMFDWATFSVNSSRGNVALFNDLASAYLYSFESTLQVLFKERGFPDFNGWLLSHVEYDLCARGLRTLRHLSAHVQKTAFSLQRGAEAHSRFAGSSRGGTYPWRWSDLTAADLASLENARISAAELPEFNALSESLLALGMMRQGVSALRGILVAAET